MDNETPLFQKIGEEPVQTGTNTAIIDMPRLQKLGDTMTHHGTQMALALALLIIGLLVVKWIDKGLRKGLKRLMPKATFITTLCNTVYVILVAIVVIAAAVEFGAKPINMLRLVTIIALVAAGLTIFFQIGRASCRERV